MKSFPHQTEPSCWLCRRSRGSCLGSQVCRAPWKCLIGTNISICNFLRDFGEKKVLRCNTDFVIECVVEHLPELLSGHVRVRVHHLEPVHIPGNEHLRRSFLEVIISLSWERNVCLSLVLYMMIQSNICWQKLVLTWQTPQPSSLSSPRQIGRSWAHRKLPRPQTSLPGGCSPWFLGEFNLIV